MTYEVGIYRGSFDPPHNGHLEVVNYALQNGIDSVTIIYQDTNANKPFRTNPGIREELLKTMFAGMQNVIISPKSYKAAVLDLSSNPTISKIHQIIGSDLLKHRVRPIQLPTKLTYFIIPRVDYPIKNPISTWNNLPAKIGKVEELIEQHNSSSLIRSLLFARNFQEAKLRLPSNVLNYILHNNLYISTDKEYVLRGVLPEVQKLVEIEISTNNLISKESYPLSFHLGEDLGISGLSKDVICFVKDNIGEPRLAIKIFLGDNYKNNYDSECLGYKTIAELKLNLVKVPNILFSYQKEEYAFIGMSFVRGKSLADMMLDSPEAIDLCARANLELHIARRSAISDIAKNKINTYNETIKQIIDKLENPDFCFLSLPLIEKVKAHWIQIQQSFLANPGLCSFTHGDPNHANWIVDLEKNYVTYIDLSLFNQSSGPDGGPCGFSINELEESLLTFRIAAKQKGKESNEKIQTIQNQYKNTYMTHAPADITTAEANRYFAAYWSLRVLNETIEKFHLANSDMQLKHKNNLINRINLFLNI